MKDNILLGQYIPSASVLHRLDPRTKLLSMLTFTISSLFINNYGGYAAATVFAGGQLLLSRIPVRKFLSGLKPVVLILSFTFAYHLFNTSGVPLWPGSAVKVTEAGIEKGLFIVWRILLLVSLASLLTLTTRPLDLAKGLEQLCKPLSRRGVPVEATALMLVIAIRFIPTIIQELDRIMLAQRARGYDIIALKGHKRMFAYLSLVVPLLITTVQRAEQLAMTIDARAYGTGRGRTSYRELILSRMDYTAGGVTLSYMLLLLYLQNAHVI
ncbi:energy-coupling factor transporter transmembrane protein EcfT [Paenibacillus sp. MMS20-IR301]|uniref:energy-coupling factor transporter transmembrane component T family protein n=1 Tax=Paenibacillus sp. MMS20-IR301 TaxID=2895946 RepID=UPI0028E58B5E|nr:energy-coupling factor transporter transmembrane protein EcfT [Paenibacillus sp. MMS20-IR301]WNS44686.1 energy-coupling factor transporter transmembrane protein EcfT [Paenibacillus sp. MMS20-IR301]